MRARCLAVALVSYLSLDLSNPMMPGAFQLVGASFESVDGSQARSEEIAEPATVAFSAPQRLAPEPRPVLQPKGPSPEIPVLGSPVPIRRTAPAAEPASSIDDD